MHHPFHHQTALEHPAVKHDDITTNLPITRPLFWAGDYFSNLLKTWGHVVSRSSYIDIHYLSYMMSFTHIKYINNKYSFILISAVYTHIPTHVKYILSLDILPVTVDS